MLWKKCVVRGALTGLAAGLIGGVVVAGLRGPSVGLAAYTLWLTALTTAAGAVSGLVTLMWLRGAAQAGARLSGARAGVVSGLVAGGIVGGGASLLVGPVAGGILGAATAAVATGVLTAAAGVPLGCTVKGWIERE